MPVVVFANPKGGVGKSTLSLVFGTVLSKQGYDVSIIDADPRNPIQTWKNQMKTQNKVNVINNVTESNIIKILQERSLLDHIVITDLEGTASRLASRAISRADLVIIPVQASTLDHDGANDIFKLIQEEEELLQRSINARIVFNRTNPLIQTKIEKEIIRSFQNQSIPTLKTHLSQRQAYINIFNLGQDLYELNPEIVSGLSSSIKNAEELSNEIITVLENIQTTHNP